MAQVTIRQASEISDATRPISSSTSTLPDPIVDGAELPFQIVTPDQVRVRLDPEFTISMRSLSPSATFETAMAMSASTWNETWLNTEPSIDSVVPVPPR